jgi:hypothetical protein
MNRRRKIMLKYVDTLTVAEFWVCPIEYGDYTGLTEDEAAQIDAWLKQYPQATFEWQDEPLFAEDAITGLMSTCLEVKIWIRTK